MGFRFNNGLNIFHGLHSQNGTLELLYVHSYAIVDDARLCRLKGMCLGLLTHIVT